MREQERKGGMGEEQGRGKGRPEGESLERSSLKVEGDYGADGWFRYRKSSKLLRNGPGCGSKP